MDPKKIQNLLDQADRMCREVYNLSTDGGVTMSIAQWGVMGELYRSLGAAREEVLAELNPKDPLRVRLERLLRSPPGAPLADYDPAVAAAIEEVVTTYLRIAAGFMLEGPRVAITHVMDEHESRIVGTPGAQIERHDPRVLRRGLVLFLSAWPGLEKLWTP